MSGRVRVRKCKDASHRLHGRGYWQVRVSGFEPSSLDCYRSFSWAIWQAQREAEALLPEMEPSA